jgi:hypothetical protein
MLAKITVAGMIASLLASPLAQACIGTQQDFAVEGDLDGGDLVKLVWLDGKGNPQEAWADDDRLPALAIIVSSMEGKKDLSPYSASFKNSLNTLSAKLKEYADSYQAQGKEAESQGDAMLALQGVALAQDFGKASESLKKFSESLENRPLTQDDLTAFFKGAGKDLGKLIDKGYMNYQVLDPKTGQPTDSENPYRSASEFGPIGHLSQAISYDGNPPAMRDIGGCSNNSYRIKPARAHPAEENSDHHKSSVDFGG